MIVGPSNVREHFENLRNNVSTWKKYVKMKDGGGKQALEKMAKMRGEIEDANDKVVDQRHSIVSSIGGTSISSIVEVDEDAMI